VIEEHRGRAPCSASNCQVSATDQAPSSRTQARNSPLPLPAVGQHHQSFRFPDPDPYLPRLDRQGSALAITRAASENFNHVPLPFLPHLLTRITTLDFRPGSHGGHSSTDTPFPPPRPVIDAALVCKRRHSVSSSALKSRQHPPRLSD